MYEREPDKWDADYINISPVLSLESVLSDLLDTTCEKISVQNFSRIYTKETFYKAKQLLGRIMNQNETKLGLFYLHRDGGIEIGEPSVALLPVSISLSATTDNYRAIQDARKGRLKRVWQARLGWLVGNLYSRVGTPDWGDTNPEDRQKKNQIIKKLISSKKYHWAERSLVESVKKKGVQIDQLSIDEVIDAIETHKPTPFYEELAEYIVKIFKDHFPDISVSGLEEFKIELLQDPLFKSASH